ncbi:MAG TPA: SDR family oxidoreductase [Terriglobales bacterium]|nr:SDR family oxidoreductase [Terriglobales bacterium]
MSDKVAVVTGSSSGIGLLATVELARRGFRVVATMRRLERRQKLDEAAAAAKVSDRLDLRRLDVTEFASLPPAVEAMVRDHGRLDVLVNNAGFSTGGFCEDMLLDEIRTQFETNFFGAVAMTQAVLPTMRQQGSGHIIMISSIAGRLGQPVVGSYCASKHALEGWSESLRVETHSLGIRVALVEPGAFETDIWTRNVRVGSKAMGPESPNKERSRRFVEFVRKDLKKRDPQPVARLIADIAENPNPRLRYLIGSDARWGFWLKTLLPWKTWEKMVAKHTHID